MSDTVSDTVSSFSSSFSDEEARFAELLSFSPGTLLPAPLALVDLADFINLDNNNCSHNYSSFSLLNNAHSSLNGGACCSGLLTVPDSPPLSISPANLSLSSSRFGRRRTTKNLTVSTVSRFGPSNTSPSMMMKQPSSGSRYENTGDSALTRHRNNHKLSDSPRKFRRKQILSLVSLPKKNCERAPSTLL